MVIFRRQKKFVHSKRSTNHFKRITRYSVQDYLAHASELPTEVARLAAVPEPAKLPSLFRATSEAAHLLKTELRNLEMLDLEEANKISPTLNEALVKAHNAWVHNGFLYPRWRDLSYKLLARLPNLRGRERIMEWLRKHDQLIQELPQWEDNWNSAVAAWRANQAKFAAVERALLIGENRAIAEFGIDSAVVRRMKAERLALERVRFLEDQMRAGAESGYQPSSTFNRAMREYAAQPLAEIFAAWGDEVSDFNLPQQFIEGYKAVADRLPKEYAKRVRTLRRLFAAAQYWTVEPIKAWAQEAIQESREAAVRWQNMLRSHNVIAPLSDIMHQRGLRAVTNNLFASARFHRSRLEQIIGEAETQFGKLPHAAQEAIAKAWRTGEVPKDPTLRKV